MLSQVVGQRKLINQREVSLLRERRIQGRSLHSLRAASGNSKEPEGFPVAWEIANAFSVAQSPIALLASRASGDCAGGAATLQPSFCGVGTCARRYVVCS